MAVKLCARDRHSLCAMGIPGCHHKHSLGTVPGGCSPAFFVVRYIILFFLFPLRLLHRAPAEGTRLAVPGLGTAPGHEDIATGAGDPQWGRGLHTRCGGHLQVSLYEGFSLLLQQLAGDKTCTAPLHMACLRGTVWCVGILCPQEPSPYCTPGGSTVWHIEVFLPSLRLPPPPLKKQQQHTFSSP